MRSTRWTALACLLAAVAVFLVLGSQGGGEAEIVGVVSGPEGPAAGALVRVQGSNDFTRADEFGRFRLAGGGRKRVTAAHDGFFIGGATAGFGPVQLRLRRTPGFDDADYEWVDPRPGRGDGSCGDCHRQIYDEWAESGHARSAVGRRFRGLYDGTDWNGKAGVGWSLLDERPDGGGVCSSCHAPALAEGEPGRLDLREIQGTAALGVHCDYCHKVAGAVPSAPGLTHGRFGLRLLRPAPAEGQLFFGPLDDVDRGDDVYSPFYRESRYCAACHEGVVFGVAVYGTYSEWRASPAGKAGKQCQDCHMKPTNRMHNFAPGHGGVERDPQTLGNHRFFAESQAEMLRAALKVNVAFEGEDVRVDVTARGVGHAVPTGFIDRHLLLIVEGKDAAGRDVEAKAGPRLPGAAGETLVGRPGVFFGRLGADEQGRTPAPFWRIDGPISDSRLRPEATNSSRYAFASRMAAVRVRLVYRRFYDEVVRVKGWPDQDVIVSNQMIRRPVEVVQPVR